MLTALNKWTELGTHVRGAVRNGASEVEIREALLQARLVLSSFQACIISKDSQWLCSQPESMISDSNTVRTVECPLDWKPFVLRIGC